MTISDPQNETIPPVIWWLRRDLRISDNPALQAALATSSRIIPLFILDPVLLNSPYSSKNRLPFLMGGLEALNSQLKGLGSYLLVRRGKPQQVLSELIAETGARAIFAETDHSPYARLRDTRIASSLPLQLHGSPAILPPGEVLKADGTAYTVFTPFLKTWNIRLKEHSLPPSNRQLDAHIQFITPAGLMGTQIEVPQDLLIKSQFPPGEAEAFKRLQSFTRGSQPPIYGYAQNRDFPGIHATSQLSPYLRFGMLSARTALAEAMSIIDRADFPGGLAGPETWITELAWRDFYIHILYHFPGVRQGNFRPLEIRWRKDPDDFDAWSQGRTGYPVIDAAMRQLTNMGWMHNRMRMLVASFLTKDLLIDWREGERWFMQYLLDGDPASNNGGWQWTAGTGTDAAPYFRVFNPVLQSKRFDPNGEYIRLWLPELAKVPGQFIHAPWEMPAEIQKRADCHIGVDYPAPIVDHAWARQRALAAYSR